MTLTPVFLRLPKGQVAALDRLASRTGRAKQHLVSELVAQALEPPQAPPLSIGRVEVSGAEETRDDEVLTLDEVASVLRLSTDAVRQRVEKGELPARRFGSEWRFSRRAVLAWLADGDKPKTRRVR